MRQMTPCAPLVIDSIQFDVMEFYLRGSGFGTYVEGQSKVEVLLIATGLWQACSISGSWMEVGVDLNNIITEPGMEPVWTIARATSTCGSQGTIDHPPLPDVTGHSPAQWLRGAAGVVTGTDFKDDNTWNRIYLGNAATWLDSGTKVEQPFSAWADGQITISSVTWAGTGAATVYVYVKDNHELANLNGHQVSIAPDL
jgi:hypothetical protein